MATGLPVIPEKITVHLGAANDPSAENIRVNFPEYIKNCASCEIYPTWPRQALIANIYAIISFTMNRVYTEYYRSQGYDFDITNNTAQDQSYVRGHDYYDTISVLVDEIFNSYVSRSGVVEPLFASYCNGTTSTCEGLSQWGSVDLAGLGYSAYRILQFYYGDDIEIVENVDVGDLRPSEPLRPLRVGIIDDDVRFIELRLNRISVNYPAIPKIASVNPVFTEETESAVKAFQQIFGLPVTGIVDNGTWYKIQYVYISVKRLNEVLSEGLALDEVELQLPLALYPGESGILVSIMQFYLSVISLYYLEVPQITATGYFGQETEEAVTAFQRVFGLEPDGILDKETGYAIYDAYVGILSSVDGVYVSAQSRFPGQLLAAGSSGEDVRTLQEYLNVVSSVYGSIPKVDVTGYFSGATEDAVSEFQRIFGIAVTGIVGPVTWDALANEYVLITDGRLYSEGQFSGEMGSGD